jgi:hypothetical protein
VDESLFVNEGQTIKHVARDCTNLDVGELYAITLLHHHYGQVFHYHQLHEEEELRFPVRKCRESFKVEIEAFCHVYDVFLEDHYS